MSQRAERPVTLDDEGEPETRTGRHGDHDVLGYDAREAVEAGVAEVNRRYAEEIAPNAKRLFKDTRHMLAGKPDYNAAALEWLHVAVYKVYHAVDKDKWPKSALIGLDWNIA